jgi:hypothetical protein
MKNLFTVLKIAPFRLEIKMREKKKNCFRRRVPRRRKKE